MVQLDERIQHASAVEVEGPLNIGGQIQYNIAINSKGVTLPVINDGLDRSSSIEAELALYDKLHGPAQQHRIGDTDTVHIYTTADRHLVVVTGPNSIQRAYVER